MQARKAVLLALALCAAARAQDIPLELPPPPWLHKSADGTLVLRSSTKGALVQIDGREMGVLPLAPQKLAPGKHLVRVSRPGFAPLEKSVSIKAGLKTQLAADLKPRAGVLEVAAEVEGARVLVDGKDAGAAPLRGFELSPGKHTVALSASGAPVVEQEVRVKAGSSYRVFAGMRELPAAKAPAAKKVEPVAQAAPKPAAPKPAEPPAVESPPLVLATPAPRKPAPAAPVVPVISKPAPVAAVQAAPAAQPVPLTKKWWFWGGAAVVAAALVAGVTYALPAVYQERRDPAAACSGSCGIVVNK